MRGYDVDFFSPSASKILSPQLNGKFKCLAIGASSAVGSALRFGAQGPGFEIGHFHKHKTRLRSRCQFGGSNEARTFLLFISGCKKEPRKKDTIINHLCLVGIPKICKIPMTIYKTNDLKL